jgi:hypothetical protein
MELLVNRETKTELSTVGSFFVDGNFESYCLEPVDRVLTSDMTPEQIAAIKMPDKTAVPTGRYQVTSYFSPKQGCNVPCMQNIPGFEFVEIHVGNFPKDTDACLLLGTATGPDERLNSRVAVAAFYPKFFDAVDGGEEVWVTYR